MRRRMERKKARPHDLVFGNTKGARTNSSIAGSTTKQTLILRAAHPSLASHTVQLLAGAEEMVLQMIGRYARSAHRGGTYRPHRQSYTASADNDRWPGYRRKWNRCLFRSRLAPLLPGVEPKLAMPQTTPAYGGSRILSLNTGAL
jgi:hypothetical protein